MDRSKQHILFLDHIRGIAILVVFFFHCLGTSFGRDQLPWGRTFRDFSTSDSVPASFLALLPVTFGWAGVAVFFVISGFCIHLSHVRSSAGDWGGFFIRRFFRIYPPYLLALLFFAFVFTGSRLSLHSVSDIGQLGSHLLLVHNGNDQWFFGINPSFWSIAVEAQLYLIYPLLLVFTGRLGWRRTLIVLGALEILLRGAMGFAPLLTGSEIPRWIATSPFTYWFSWAIGAALAEAWMEKRPLPFRSLPILPLLVLGVGTYFVKTLAPFSFMFFALATTALTAQFLSRPEPLKLDGVFWNHLRILGIWSYSFYLLHQPMVGAVPRVLHKLKILPSQSFAKFLCCLCIYPIVVLVSSLYYKHFELHSIAWGKFFLRRKIKPAEGMDGGSKPMPQTTPGV